MKKMELYSNQLKVGKRTYFFDVKQTKELKRYLVITESKKLNTNSEYLRNQIMIFEEDIEKFGGCLNKALINFYKNPVIASSKMAETKLKNAYKPWTEEDDFQLEVMFCEGKRISEIAKYFERNKGAITSRIKKLELREKYPHI
jgi:hypothetical protein